jgi:hypothetical protein
MGLGSGIRKNLFRIQNGFTTMVLAQCFFSQSQCSWIRIRPTKYGGYFKEQIHSKAKNLIKFIIFLSILFNSGHWSGRIRGDLIRIWIR